MENVDHIVKAYLDKIAQDEELGDMPEKPIKPIKASELEGGIFISFKFKLPDTSAGDEEFEQTFDVSFATVRELANAIGNAQNWLNDVAEDAQNI